MKSEAVLFLMQLLSSCVFLCELLLHVVFFLFPLNWSFSGFAVLLLDLRKLVPGLSFVWQKKFQSISFAFSFLWWFLLHGTCNSLLFNQSFDVVSSGFMSSLKWALFLGDGINTKNWPVVSSYTFIVSAFTCKSLLSLKFILMSEVEQGSSLTRWIFSMWLLI